MKWKILTATALISVIATSAHADELECLALNVYHEARGESMEGRIAVAYVTKNRMEHEWFPDSICNVIKQGGTNRRYKCQFTWYCDGKSDTPRNQNEWLESLDVAEMVYNQQVEDPTQGALFYHAERLSPAWTDRLDYWGSIGNHIFYHWDGDWNNDQ